MEFAGLALFALILAVGVWALNRLLSRTERNDDSTRNAGFGGGDGGF